MDTPQFTVEFTSGAVEDFVDDTDDFNIGDQNGVLTISTADGSTAYSPSAWASVKIRDHRPV